MALGDKDKKVSRKTGIAKTAPADDFNNVAEISPRANRSQLITEVKNILKQNVSGNNFTTFYDEELTPTPNQKKLMATISDVPVALVDGPFGTGKTLWTTYMALQGLTEKKYRRISITAPAIEAGEQLGFQPGDKDAKMLPYINQILESIDDWVGKDLRVKLQEAGIIEIESHAFMRGRTFKNTIFILDECQNASGPNLMTALTRLGKDSTFVFMGDNRQNDRTNGDSAFVAFINRFTDPKYLEGGFVGHAVLDKTDVRRHPFLEMIVEEGDDTPLVGFEDHKPSRTAHVTPRKPQTASKGNGHDVHGFPMARPC